MANYIETFDSVGTEFATCYYQLFDGANGRENVIALYHVSLFLGAAFTKYIPGTTFPVLQLTFHRYSALVPPVHE